MSYTTVSLILNGIFALCLVCGFLIGFWRGAKRSSVNLLFGVVGALIAFFTTPLVTNAILGATVSINGEPADTLNNFIYNSIANNETISSLIERVPNIKPLIAGLPAALINVVVFFMMMLAISFVTYIIYKIIAVAFLRRKKNADGTKAKMHRTLGGAVGALKTLIIMVFAFMPLTSLIGLADTIMTEGDYFVATQPENQNTSAEINSDENEVNPDDQESSNFITQSIPQEVKDSVKAFHNSAYGWFGGLFGMDDALFDYYSTIKIEGENVKIRSEIDSYWRVYDAFTQMQKIGSEGFDKNYADLNFKKIDPIVDTILNNGLFKTVIANVVYDTIKNYNQEGSLIPPESVEDYAEILDAIVASFDENTKAFEYFSHDLKSVYEAFKILCKQGVMDDIKTAQTNLEQGEEFNALKIIASEKNFEALKATLSKVFELKMIRAGIEPVSKLLISNLVEDVELVVDTSEFDDAKWKETAENLAGILKSAFALLDEVELDRVMNNPLSLLAKTTEKDEQGKEVEVNAYDLDKIFSNLGQLLDLVTNNDLFGDVVVNKLLKTESMDLTAPDATVELYDANGERIIPSENGYTYTNVFYQIMYPSMKVIQDSKMYYHITNGAGEISINAVELLEFIAEYSMSEDGQHQDFLVKAILPLTQVEPTKSMLIGDVFGKMEDTIKFSELKTYQDWENDLTQLSKILITLRQTEFKNSEGQDTNGIRVLLGGSNDAISELMNNIGRERFTALVEPMLLAKSTKDKAQSILTLTAEAIQKLVANIGGETLKIQIPENLTPEQANEIATVMGEFADVYQEFTKLSDSDKKLENIDTEKIGNLLNSMQDNAMQEDSVFGQTFDAMANYVESELKITLQKNEQGNYANNDFKALLAQYKGELVEKF